MPNLTKKYIRTNGWFGNRGVSQKRAIIHFSNAEAKLDDQLAGGRLSISMWKAGLSVLKEAST
ncbi:hypothetical protein [Pedosphaera parvula]|uniref:Uncharacterized protein n=1 Tax=Pedosphaera parvula (strain Ellin514) TaxID=320771 RepID=B9XHY1_PEDPL|nr:hypothetical protein [Pedosphaera parvula]EEF60474.1 hypothetical protein Cflav_PD3444 [Pedosphaera parvula Ellin514]